MDPSERIIRRGALTGRSLVDAVATEQRTGRHPVLLAVGSLELERAAIGILDGSSGLDALRASVPNVVLDEQLPADGWELREAEHA